MYPYNRNTQLYHSRAKETQAEKPSLLAQDKRLEELLSLARTEATETTRKFETLLDRAELSEAEQILRTMYLDGKKHLRLLQEVGFLIFGTTPQENEACETEEATETSYNGQNMGSVLQGLLGYLLPCVLKDITLEPDGNIIANYSGDAFNEENKDLFIGNVLTAFLNMDIEDQDMITDAIKDYQYTTSPKGLAYWFQRDGKIVIKLDLPAIISQVASGSGKVIDKNIISSISDAIFSIDALKLKSLLKTVNGQLQNEILGFIVSMNDQSFATFFDWLSNGIPMHIKIQNGHSYIYLDKEGIAPILKLLGDFHPIVLKMLPSLLPPEMAGLAGFLEPLIDMLFITWPECALLVQSFDLGLDLVPQN